jgi:uncharacterized damage-inducible protein DinB
VSTPERRTPPMHADERPTLEGWLDFYRTTLAQKCAGLTDEQLRTAAVPPSPITLLGLLLHLAEVERNWFHRVLTGEDVPPIHGPRSDPHGHDGGFDLTGDATGEQALATWRAEVEHARGRCAQVALDATRPFAGTQVTLRWIYSHMIAEYARHCGHADLLRERIDGRTGV